VRQKAGYLLFLMALPESKYVLPGSYALNVFLLSVDESCHLCCVQRGDRSIQTLYFAIDDECIVFGNRNGRIADPWRLKPVHCIPKPQ